MFELFQESFRIPNIPATVLLLIVIVYWVVNLIGLFDLEMLHAHADTDFDSDSDGHVDHDSFFGKVFDFGDLPIAIVFSFFILVFWMGTILSNYYLGNPSLIIALLIYIPNIIFAFAVARIISIPLSKVYKYLNENSEEAREGDFTGSVCTVDVEATSEKMGQGEINRNGDAIRVNIKTSEGKMLKKGQLGLLIEYFGEKGYYLAEPYEQPN